MRLFIKGGIILLIIFLVYSTRQEKVLAQSSEKRGCAMCHARWIEESGPLEALKKKGVLLLDDIDIRLAADEDICYGCHDGSVLDSRMTIRKHIKTRHPVDIVPSKKIVIPSNFPLDKNGKLFCGTCHSAHGGLENENQEDVEKGTFLRFPNKNSQLCKMCHVDKLGGRSKGTHPIDVNSLQISQKIVDNGGIIGGDKPNQVICESCHVVHGSPYDKLLVLSQGKNSQDEASELCEACHKNNPSVSGHGPGMDTHPVDVKTKVAVIPDKWASGRTGVKTQDGRIICLSCHNLHEGVNNTPLLEFVGNSNENYKNFLCKQCHGDKLSTGKMGQNPGTHPVDLVIPETMKINSKIPLESGRKLMCISCHMPHNASNNSNTDGTDGRILRVTNENSMLCKECHSEKYAEGIQEAELKGMHPILVKPKDVVIENAINKGGQTGKDGVLVCTSCHNIHKGKKGTPILIEQSEDSKVCGVCHQSKLIDENDRSVTAMKHPVGQKPVKVNIPKEIYDAGGKLGKNGEIICAICHKVHQSYQNTPLLLMENKKNSMCLLCHVDKLTVAASDHNLGVLDPMARNLRGETVAESGICSACHFSHQWARPLDGNGDMIQQFCLSCHSNGRPAEKKLIGNYTHPTGVDIKKVGDGTTTLPLYKDRGLGKTYSDRKVFCSSCHNVHKWSPDKEDKEEDHYKNIEGDATNSFLRKLNDNKSGLCLDCHKDKKNVVNTEHDLNITAPNVKNTIGQTASEGGVCSACHLPHNGMQRRMWAREVSGKEDAGSQLCKSCHSEKNPGKDKLLSDKFTHPVNADIRNADGSSTLPLFNEDGKLNQETGKVICYSCHEPHQWDPTKKEEGPGKNTEGDGNNSFLRLRNDYELTLCADCHEDKKFIRKTDHDLTITAPDSKNKDGKTVSESGICLVCHSIHNGLDNKMWNRVLADAGDVIGKLCFSCHFKGKVGENKLVGELTHPTNKTILAVDRVPDPTKFPTFTIEGQKTSKGKVYCNSCHDLHKWDPGKNEEGPGKNTEGDGTNSFLRETNANSELCLECHTKKKFISGTKHDMKVSGKNSKNILNQEISRSGVCGVCHIPHNATDYRLWARLPFEGNDLGSVLCLSCHSKGKVGEKKLIGQYSHPVNVRFDDNPKVDGSTNFPIYNEKNMIVKSEGKVICMSCHDVHKWNPSADEFGDGTMAEGTGANSFLRKANDNKADLCTDCHGEKSFIIGTDHDLSVTAPNEKNYLGQSIFQSGPCSACHSVHNAYMSLKLWARIPGKNPDERQMDMMATFCYSCHQPGSVGGAKVPEVLFHPPSILVSTVGRSGKGKDSYWPVYNLQGDLVGSGMITCPTCHNLHKWQPDIDLPGNYKNIEGDALNSFLRNKGASFSLCTDCHESDAIMRYKYYHIERIRYPHRGNVH
ncbi:MAG: cytochrome c3 family protein [Candidatus Firestonebacteria bacterium]|nr:cytochrome c3 family protein [Candidatus Firestonebacteria bacterium]